MSVASVTSQWTVPVAVADELESFFHVMLFYAVQYLPHTIRNVTGFIAEYFDICEEDEDGNCFCSPVKENAMKHQQILFAHTYLVFTRTTGERGNPINSLIKALLKLFEARYKVIEHNKSLEDIAKLAEAATCPPSLSLDPKSGEHQRNNIPLPPGIHITDCLPASSPELSTKTVEAAAQLNTHIAVLRLFGGMMTIGEEAWQDTGYRPMPRLRKLVIDTNMTERVEGTPDTGDRLRASKRIKADTA